MTVKPDLNVAELFYELNLTPRIKLMPSGDLLPFLNWWNGRFSMFGNLNDILRLTVRPGSNVELFCELNLLPRIGNVKWYPTWHSKAWGVVVWLTEDWQARYKGRTSHELNLIPWLKLTTKAWPLNQALQSSGEHFAITTSPHWPCTRPLFKLMRHSINYISYLLLFSASVPSPAPPQAPAAPPPPPPPAPAPTSPPPKTEVRGALLSSISSFSKSGLKKTVTVDKSAPKIWDRPISRIGQLL